MVVHPRESRGGGGGGGDGRDCDIMRQKLQLCVKEHCSTQQWLTPLRITPSRTSLSFVLVRLTGRSIRARLVMFLVFMIVDLI